MYYYINKQYDNSINNWALKFLINSAGFNAVKINEISNQIQIYYGNEPKEINALKNAIILQKKEYSLETVFSVNKLSNPEILPFDIIEATILFLTDKVHKGLSSANYDKHNRLKSASSIYFKNKSLQKPIVNAYVQLLKKNIQEKFNLIPIPLYPKNYKSVVILSHDVDEPERYAVLRTLKNIDHLSNKSKTFLYWIRLRKIIRKKIFGGEKSYWNFEKIIDEESKYGFCSTFFFSAKSRFEKSANFSFDNSYEIEVNEFRELFELLNSKGFEIGLHSSYNAEKNTTFFEEEKNKLEQLSKRKIIGNRHHFWKLGEDSDSTLVAHSNAGFKYDSSTAFNDSPGYRRGVALPYNAFDQKTSVSLSTLQIPNFLMDTNLVDGENETKILERAELIISELKKANGVGSINWHVRMSYPSDKSLSKYGRIYLKILKILSNNKDIWVTSFENFLKWQKEREDLINAQ